jgi:hypothetical protein
MHYRVWVAGAVLLSGCGKTLSAPASTQTSATPDATFSCVKQQLGALGYKQTSIDVDERRITARKVDPKAHRASTEFVRLVNKLDVKVAAEADGQTSLQVEGRTFVESMTRRGPTDSQEAASEEVKSATQQLLERCRS